MRQPVPQPKRSSKTAPATAPQTVPETKLGPMAERKPRTRHRPKVHRVRGRWFELAGAINQQHMMMAVPKRFLKRAVDRNMVRRLAREAWRARRKVRSPGVDPGSLPDAPTPDRSGAGGRTADGGVLLRLLRRPEVFEALPRGQCRQALRAELERVVADWTGG